MQFQTEKSMTNMYGTDVNFYAYNFMHCFGVEKRFKNILIGKTHFNGFVLGIDIPLCTAISFANGKEFAESSFLGLDLNLGYQFNSGIRLGYIQRFTGTNYTYAVDISYWTYIDNFSSSYKTSNSAFYFAYILKGKRKAKINANLIVQPNTPLPSREPIINREPTINTENLTDEQLQSLLQDALQKENYQLAEQYQKEVDKRKVAKEYANKTLPELNKMMNDAIKAEDYKKAEEIQKCIDKKGKGNGNNNSKQPANKSLQELENDLKKAMDAEDYKKAEDIQKQINLIKKP